jgi:pullulanase/glycogen debranching enzyme
MTCRRNQDIFEYLGPLTFPIALAARSTPSAASLAAALPLTQRNRPLALQRDNLWYKDAVIYQLHVRTFFDSNADGVGDFPGLTQKLDYLQQLGITAIWLLPFYPSPLRDDGYDIADYTSVNATYGSCSNSAQAVERNVQRYKGYVPIEMFGRNLFPRFGDLPYLLTLGHISSIGFKLRRLDPAV